MASPQQLLKDIPSGKTKVAYYFYGAEDYRRVEAEKYLASQFLPQAQRATNYRRIDGRKSPSSIVIAELSNLPMLGERQVIAISDFQSFRPKDVERILALLKPPDPNRVVIFSSPAARTPKKKSKFFQTVSKAAEPVEFRKLTQEAVRRQITVKLDKQGRRIDSEALELMVGLVAGSRGALDTEVAKLMDFKPEGDSISVEDVASVTAGHEMYDIFGLADCLIAGDTPRVLAMIRSLLQSGTSPAGMIPLILPHFVNIYLVKNGKRPIGRWSWLAGKFRDQAGGFSNERLESIIVAIAAADAEMRLTGVRKDIVLETLALSLAGENRN
jgi:DNA polymerase-3 subunit delta